MFESWFGTEYASFACAICAGLLGSVAFGVVGTLVVTRNLVAIGGAIAHAVIGGVGAACFCHEKFGWEWFSPMLGAFLAGMAAALLIGAASLYAKQREDTIIGVIWAVGMAAGLLLAGESGHSHEAGGLEAFLFGDIQHLNAGDLKWMLLMDGAVLLAAGVFHNWIFAVIFDREFAALRGVRANLVYLGILQIVAVTVVLMVNMVGVLLVIALLALPAAAAGELSGRLSVMMPLACIFAAVFSCGGITAGFFAGLPAGPMIVITAAVFYAAVLFAGRLMRRAGQKRSGCGCAKV